VSGRWSLGRAWVVGEPRVEETATGRRVVARVNRAPITFEASDVPLRPSVEAFAGLLLLPALARGKVVRVEGELDARWLDGARRMASTFARWWGWPDRFPLRPEAVRDAAGPAGARRGLCFTGGVDSFLGLLSDPGRYDDLLFVHGYDIPLTDRARLDAFVPALEEVARAFGKQVLLLASDVRRHRTFTSVSWEQTHGAALAAAGHVLGRRLRRLTFGPSWMYTDLRPWGTHPETDPLWSSSALAIEAGEASLNRDARIRRIADHPLVQRHLRVCWENRAPTGNCSRCEKCVRTMVVLAGLGLLDRFEVFDRRVDLARAVDALPAYPAGFGRVWGPFLDLELPPALRAAVARLLERSA
jgi:hypothetical protein